MISSTCGVVLLLAQLTVGGPLSRATEPASCAACGVENGAIQEKIALLQTCPNWRVRDNAAHALRRFDWRCHPEIVAVLATSLLNDRHEEVREESAQTLTKLAPCVPIAHEALSRAANLDPDHATRHWARKGLKALSRRCEGQCQACSTSVNVTPEVRPIPGLPFAPATPEKSLPPSIDSSVAPRSNEELPEANPLPAPRSEMPKLEGPRIEPATATKERPRRGVLSLGIRSVFSGR